MLWVFAAILDASAADPWPITVGRIEAPEPIRLAENAPDATKLVGSDVPLAIAFVAHEGAEAAVHCGNDVRFRCFAVTPSGAMELCAGPGGTCLDGRRLEIPRRAEGLPHRATTTVPEECAQRLGEAADGVTTAVQGALSGEVGSSLRAERAALAAPRMIDACKGWYGSSPSRYNRAWCELQAAEHVALYSRVVGSPDGTKPVLDALVADCCVGGACPTDPWFDPAVPEASAKPAEP